MAWRCGRGAALHTTQNLERWSRWASSRRSRSGQNCVLPAQVPSTPQHLSSDERVVDLACRRCLAAWVLELRCLLPLAAVEGALVPDAVALATGGLARWVRDPTMARCSPPTTGSIADKRVSILVILAWSLCCIRHILVGGWGERPHPRWRLHPFRPAHDHHTWAQLTHPHPSRRALLNWAIQIRSRLPTPEYARRRQWEPDFSPTFCLPPPASRVREQGWIRPHLPSEARTYLSRPCRLFSPIWGEQL